MADVHCELLSGPYVNGTPLWTTGDADYQPPDGFDPPQGVVLTRWFNLKRSDGQWKPPEGGDYIEEWQAVAERRAKRKDRMSPRVVLDAPIIATIETVRKNRRQKPRSPVNQYSKIGQFIRRADSKLWTRQS